MKIVLLNYGKNIVKIYYNILTKYYILVTLDFLEV